MVALQIQDKKCRSRNTRIRCFAVDQSHILSFLRVEQGTNASQRNAHIRIFAVCCCCQSLAIIYIRKKFIQSSDSLCWSLPLYINDRDCDRDCDHYRDSDLCRLAALHEPVVATSPFTVYVSKITSTVYLLLGFFTHKRTYLSKIETWTVSS